MISNFYQDNWKIIANKNPNLGADAQSPIYFFIEFLFSIYWLSRIFFILPAFAPDTNEPKKEKKEKDMVQQKLLNFWKNKILF